MTQQERGETNRIKVLLVLCAVYERKGTVTHSDLVEVLGFSKSTINKHLWELYDEGFVEWEEGKQATLRPLVERVA